MTLLSRLTDRYKSSDVVFRATVWFTAATVLNKAVSLLTQPVINRILTVDDVGVCGVYSTWQAVFAVIATFSLHCGVLEVLVTKKREDSRQAVGSLTVLSLIICTAFFGVATLLRQPLSGLLKLKPEYIVLMGAEVASQAVIQFWSVPKRFEYSYKIYSLTVCGLFISKSVLTVLFSLLFTGDRVFGRLFGLCVPEVILSVVLLISILRKTDFSRLRQYWGYAVRFNIPIIPHYLSTLILSSSDKVMLQRMIGDTPTGLYTFAYTYSSMALIVFNALNSAYTPFAYTAIREHDYEPLRKKTGAIVLFSVLMSSAMVLLAPEAVYFLGGDKYKETLPAIPVLVLGVFLSSFYYIFSNVEFVYEKNRYVFPITLCGGLINIVLNYLLIPRFGYIAAGFTTVIGYLFISVAHYLVSRKLARGDIFGIRKILLYFGLLTVVCASAGVLYNHTAIRHGIISLALTAAVIVFIKKAKEKKQNGDIQK